MADENSTIIYCYATGNVNATGTSVGGLVGRNSGYGAGFSTVRNCIAANDSVTTTSVSSSIGRVIGGMGGITSHTNNYANSAMVVLRNGEPISTHDNGTNGTGKTLAQLKIQSFYTTASNWYNNGAWNFSTIWKICEGHLPMFQWQTCPPPPPTPPTITTTSLSNGIITTSYNQTLTATGTTPITWSLENGSLPNNLTLSTAGVISGTPNTAGTFNFTVKATNSVGSDTKSLTIIVTAPPVITTTTLQGGVVGTVYNQTLTATGTTPISWTLESGSLPSNLSLSTAGVISGTPTTTGTFNFTVKATNSVGNDTKALTIIVSAPPIITTTTLPGGVVGTAYNQTLTATGTTLITWSLENGSLPNNLTLSSAGVISGTPNTAGTFNFTVKATNSAGSDTKNLSIAITAAPVAPTITTTTFPTGTTGIVYNAQIEATGTAPITWTLESGNLPNNLSLSTAGVISGTPTTAGTFNFNVKATNSAGNDTKPLSITIISSVIAPTITTTTLPDGKTGTAYSAQLEATGTAPITWTLESNSLPAGVTLSAAGVISGTPTETGTFSFTVQATNSAGNDTKALSIFIDGVGISENEVLNITVYPNPTTGELRIESGELEIECVEIIDMVGKRYTIRAIHREKEITVDMSDLPTGIYFVKIRTTMGEVTRKVVKE